MLIHETVSNFRSYFVVLYITRVTRTRTCKCACDATTITTILLWRKIYRVTHALVNSFVERMIFDRARSSVRWNPTTSLPRVTPMEPVFFLLRQDEERWREKKNSKLISSLSSGKTLVRDPLRRF